jgi:hypothetical protein
MVALPERGDDPSAAPDAELVALARITLADVVRARQAWERSASPEFRRLLDALPTVLCPAVNDP